MCIICVEIMRERITVKDAIQGFKESIRAGVRNTPEADHQAEIVGADAAGDETKVQELIRRGYKKERWL